MLQIKNKQMKKEWFENWFDSPYYPILYKNRDAEEAAYFVNMLFDKLELPAQQRILDIACGEGRFAKIMAEKGHEVIGIDLSEQRIEAAQQLINEDLSLKFQVHDMRLPYFMQYFDYAFNFFTSFGYFSNMRDTQSAVRTMYQALKPGGILVIDFLNAKQVIDNLVPEEKIERDGLVFDITKKVERHQIVKTIVVDDPKDGKHYFEERVSAFGLEDFKKLFTENQKFELVSYVGDYDLSPFDEKTSPRLIMKFRK